MSLTRNILNLDHKPSWVQPNVSCRIDAIGFNDIKINANFKKEQAWSSVYWGFPSGMIEGAKYTFSYGPFKGDQTQHMLISVDRRRAADDKRDIIADLYNAAGGKVTFIYDSKKFKGYRIKLFFSKGVSAAYTGKFEGVFKDLYLAQEGSFSGFVPFVPAGPIEKRIVNNEILDKRREELAGPILTEIEGFKFDPVSVDTIGLGYFELGDSVNVVNNDKYYSAPILNYSLDLTSGVKEKIGAAAAIKTNTEYNRTSSIEKHIYNTEIEVDKQKQTITSVVSEQKQQGEKIEDNYSKMVQMVGSITQTIQKTGGANLIKNSVGYGKDSDGKLQSWLYEDADNDKVNSESSPTALNYGAISGSHISIRGTKIRQRVAVAMGETYTLSCRVNKGVAGVAKIKLSNITDLFEEVLEGQKSYNWEEKVIVVKPSRHYVDIEFIAENGTILQITDVMFAQGDTRRPWQQSSGEVYNTQVSLTEDGMKVTNSNHSGDYINISSQEVAGYSDASGSKKKVFTLNRDTTEVEKLQSRTQIEMPPLKIIPILSGTNSGWAILPSEGGE